MTVHDRRTNRHIGLTASAAVAGAKLSRQTVFIKADVLQLSAKSARSYAARAQDNGSRIYQESRYYRSLGIVRTTRNPKEGC